MKINLVEMYEDFYKGKKKSLSPVSSLVVLAHVHVVQWVLLASNG